MRRRRTKLKYRLADCAAADKFKTLRRRQSPIFFNTFFGAT
jgi:hypothetical protein